MKKNIIIFLIAILSSLIFIVDVKAATLDLNYNDELLTTGITTYLSDLETIRDYVVDNLPEGYKYTYMIRVKYPNNGTPVANDLQVIIYIYNSNVSDNYYYLYSYSSLPNVKYDVRYGRPTCTNYSYNGSISSIINNLNFMEDLELSVCNDKTYNSSGHGWSGYENGTVYYKPMGNASNPNYSSMILYDTNLNFSLHPSIGTAHTFANDLWYKYYDYYILGKQKLYLNAALMNDSDNNEFYLITANLKDIYNPTYKYQYSINYSSWIDVTNDLIIAPEYNIYRYEYELYYNANFAFRVLDQNDLIIAQEVIYIDSLTDLEIDEDKELSQDSEGNDIINIVLDFWKWRNVKNAIFEYKLDNSDWIDITNKLDDYYRYTIQIKQSQTLKYRVRVGDSIIVDIEKEINFDTERENLLSELQDLSNVKENMLNFINSIKKSTDFFKDVLVKFYSSMPVNVKASLIFLFSLLCIGAIVKNIRR